MLLLSVKTDNSKHTKLEEDKWGIARSISHKKRFKMRNKKDKDSNQGGTEVAEYKEKIWGKQVGGDYVTDGYTFRGKHAFGKARDGLKDFMKKGVVREVNDIKIKVLDVRKNGSGTDIEVELTENNVRGIAVIQLFGPNSKNENVVMVRKSKESEHKYVIMLAEKVVKPLVRDFLADNIDLDNCEEKEIVSEKEDTLVSFKCPFCDKTSFSSPGLKCHITKMHKDKTAYGSKDIAKVSVDSTEELLDESMSSLNEGDSGKISLEESEHSSPGKLYTHKCKNCEYKSEASKNYIALQIIKKHVETCCPKKLKKKTKNCDLCDFAAKDGGEMRRHMRDKHDVMTSSTSPPPKKTKVQDKTSEHIILIDDDDDNDDEKVEDISLGLEQMEIDDNEESSEDRSNFWDDKINRKEERINDENLMKEGEKKEIERKKKVEDQKRLTKVKKEKKQRNQKVKDLNKKANKKVRQSEKSITKKEIPNIKAVPRNCLHLVNEGDMVYVVPGNGCCGPNCAAAFFFHDEIFGPKLRIQMNHFQAKHWNRRYKYITNCSEDNPFVRKLKGGEVKFEDPEELIKYLENSEEAAFMWTDCEDLAVISDMYQITIKVITTKSVSDENPRVNWIYPEKEMASFAMLKDIQLGEMVLLHEDEIHFNLIVSKDSDLANLGSLSHRFSVGPIIENKKDEDVKSIDNYVELQNQFRKLQQRNKAIEEQYIQCEKELRRKTEEAEKLKSEVKDLKLIVDLEKATKEINDGDGRSVEGEEIISMRKRNDASERSNIIKQSKAKKKEEEFNCNECDYQGMKPEELNKHYRLRHTMEGRIKCRNCGKDFELKSNLMIHRKLEHKNTVAMCRNNAEGKCSFSADLCWWSHKEGSEKDIECFFCDEKFESRALVMMHRKRVHSKTVKLCSQFMNLKCNFGEESCWFKHEHEQRVSSPENSEKKQNSESVFQKDSVNPDPPLGNL